MLNGPSSSAMKYVPGIGTAVLIAALSSFLSAGHVAVDPLILSMLISIIIGNFLGHSPRLEAGISLSHRLFIPIGIVLYGSQVDSRPLQVFGYGRILHILVLVGVAVTLIYWLSARLGISKKLGMLLAAGSAVCGASAIMVLSPVIKSRKEETSVSLIAITVIGLAGVIIYPLVQETFDLSEKTYAILCGSTLYQMGQVKAAAYLMSGKALELAVPIKLLRIGTLLPIALIFSYITRDPQEKLFVPWFILGSVAVALVTNFFPPLAALRGVISPSVTFLFSIAIAGIGLTVELESVIDVGPKPLLAVFLGWLVLIGLFITGIMLID